jgi:NADPH:quinone reductase
VTDYRWMATDFGGPEALRRVEVDVPEPSHGQLRIDVRASGVNPADAKHIAPGQDRSLLPLTIGMEVSGIVSATGGGSAFSVGDEVLTLVSGGYSTALTAPASGVHRSSTTTGPPTISGG